jgi:hypothetical protein
VASFPTIKLGSRYFYQVRRRIETAPFLFGRCHAHTQPIILQFALAHCAVFSSSQSASAPANRRGVGWPLVAVAQPSPARPIRPKPFSILSFLFSVVFMRQMLLLPPSRIDCQGNRPTQRQPPLNPVLIGRTRSSSMFQPPLQCCSMLPSATMCVYYALFTIRTALA